MNRDVFANLSARIVAKLERGAAPWIKPWSGTPGANTPCNAVSSRPYSGCNVVLLWMAQAVGYRTPRFLTFKQALELGGNVRKGEHGTRVTVTTAHPAKARQAAQRGPSGPKSRCAGYRPRGAAKI
jgi:antirestriction protein ArdC